MLENIEKEKNQDELKKVDEEVKRQVSQSGERLLGLKINFLYNKELHQRTRLARLHEKNRQRSMREKEDGDIERKKYNNCLPTSTRLLNSFDRIILLVSIVISLS